MTPQKKKAALGKRPYGKKMRPRPTAPPPRPKEAEK
jgi:hypothetical protein